MNILILIAIIIGIFYLGRYAIRAGISIEQNKKLLENMRKHEKKSKK
tara:strand:- start:4331 stop:4471 length:141 start_codon:yes stop_codon:yes gene_type:complete